MVLKRAFYTGPDARKTFLGGITVRDHNYICITLSEKVELGPTLEKLKILWQYCMEGRRLLVHTILSAWLALVRNFRDINLDNSLLVHHLLPTLVL